MGSWKLHGLVSVGGSISLESIQFCLFGKGHTLIWQHIWFIKLQDAEEAERNMRKQSLESSIYRNSLPAAPRINMVHEEFESEVNFFSVSVSWDIETRFENMPIYLYCGAKTNSHSVERCCGEQWRCLVDGWLAGVDGWLAGSGWQACFPSIPGLVEMVIALYEAKKSSFLTCLRATYHLHYCIHAYVFPLTVSFISSYVCPSMARWAC